MDSISTKILEARSIKAKMEEQLLKEQVAQAAALKATPEFKRLVRVTDARLLMYRTFKERCELIQRETGGLAKNERLIVEIPEIDPTVAIVHSCNVTAWTVCLGEEASLRIETDPAGFDDTVDFFGSLTILGKYSGLQTFWVSPEGKVFLLENAGEFTPPNDYYSLRKVLNEGEVSVGTSFEALLEGGLEALVRVALEGRMLPKGWARVDSAIAVLAPRKMMIGASPPKDVSKTTFEELGVDVSELKRLAGMVPAAASQA